MKKSERITSYHSKLTSQVHEVTFLKNMHTQLSINDSVKDSNRLEKSDKRPLLISIRNCMING